jgi:hypothetical protein
MREVTIPGKGNAYFRADGVIHNRGVHTFVEVSFLKGGSMISKIRKDFQQLLTLQGYLEDSIEPTKFLLACIVDSKEHPIGEAVLNEIQRLSSLYGISYMLFEHSDLVKKYGFSDN